MKKHLRIALLAGVTLAAGLLPFSQATTHANTVSDSVAVLNKIFNAGQPCYNLFVKTLLPDIKNKAQTTAPDAETTAKQCAAGVQQLGAISVPNADPDATKIVKFRAYTTIATGSLGFASLDVFHLARGDSPKSGAGNGSSADLNKQVNTAVAALNARANVAKQIIKDLHLNANKAFFQFK